MQTKLVTSTLSGSLTHTGVIRCMQILDGHWIKSGQTLDIWSAGSARDFLGQLAGKSGYTALLLDIIRNRNALF